MIRIKSNGSKLIQRLTQQEHGLKKSLSRGLSRWAVLAHKEAHRLLSGSGKDGAGAYPVPVRTGQLRRAEAYVLPGRAKHGIAAHDNQAFLINTAKYASVIHESRPFAQDGIENTRSQGAKIMLEEIRKGLMAVSAHKSGLI